ncbi:uncharacterized protein [Battus philenor]|uniref:uncharacterized protein isoform X2 n=1 Tax=Battus philenor TaxID=42288 RepID=UPI0035D0FFF5
MLLNKYFASITEHEENVSKLENRSLSVNGDGDVEDVIVEDELGLVDNMDPELHLELVQLKMEHLKLQEAQLQCKQRMLILNRTGKKSGMLGTTRSILADGRIVVKNLNERVSEPVDSESLGVGSGDANVKRQRSWAKSSSGDCSSASTCVQCEEKSQINLAWDSQDKSDVGSKITGTSKITTSNPTSKTIDLSKDSKGPESVSKRSDFTSERRESDKESGGMLYEFKFSDFSSNEEHDETNRLIQLRNSDYLDIVDEKLKVVIAPNGYPKSKMRLRQMENFQRSLSSIIDMQLKAGLLKKVPSFLDYYLNRGAIVCICRDLDTRDWIVRVSVGLEERMKCELIVLGSKVKRICLGVLKIPKSCWPATALDVFKLLQYFNPTLKTDLWKIYAQKISDSMECTSFLIDRVSGEIIRGPTFKNVIDYNIMEFELTGYTEIYYENFLTELRDDLSSVASRVKLLDEMKSEEIVTTAGSSVNMKVAAEMKDLTRDQNDSVETKDLENSENKLKRLKEIEYIDDRNETNVWSENIHDTTSIQDNDTTRDEIRKGRDETASSAAALTEVTDSLAASNENLMARNSTVTIDSNRGIAYHRRTNYLHVDAELKVAITLEGYPNTKLEGTHIRRLKRLFKEYLHKDIKNRRFTNLIIPKFQDVYLSNGAVIYICDSLETKEYLSEILPKFVNSTSLKLVFKDVNNLVRFTRVVMRLPKELAHLESKEIISKLVEKYPTLKPDCWKYYSDVAGKQKRQFGIEPESIDIIKNPEFEFMYNDEAITFRIIDRKRKDVSFNETDTKSTVENVETEALWEQVSKEMYCPIDSDIMSSSLTRIRTNHYSDLVADDLKLYVGPSNYPETRVDEALFFTIKNGMNSIVLDSVKNAPRAVIPKIHDMYLFDGVIFIICKDVITKQWIEDHISVVNTKLHLNLKSTEFRGAVGIVSMVVKTDKDTDEVISILQKQNPRLRTKYWRKISIVRSKAKLDVVLQIDKLSAQVISNANFNKYIGSSAVQFKLGHLQSLIRPKKSLEYLDRKHDKKNDVQTDTPKSKNEMGYSRTDTDKSDYETSSDIKNVGSEITYDVIKYVDQQRSSREIGFLNEKSTESFCKLSLKVPSNILPENKEDFNILLDLLEDKNPGLNTELWQIKSEYPNKGKFTVLVDKQSATVIRSKSFDPTLGGEKLKFSF